MQMPLFFQLTSVQILPMIIFQLAVLLVGFRYRKITVFLECFMISLILCLSLTCDMFEIELISWAISIITSLIIGLFCSVYPLFGLGVWAGVYSYAIAYGYFGTVISLIIGFAITVVMFMMIGKRKKYAAILTMSFLAGFRLIYLFMTLLGLQEKDYAWMAFLMGTILIGTIGVLVQLKTSKKSVNK